MELGLAHAYDAGCGIDVAEREARHLAAAQSGRVEQHDGQAEHRPAQRRVRCRGDGLGAGQHPCDLLGPHQDRRPVGLRPGEVHRIRNEARRLGPAPMQAEQTDDPLACPSGVGGERRRPCGPSLEGLLVEVLGADLHEEVPHAAEDVLLGRVATAEGAPVVEEAADGVVEHEAWGGLFHDATPRCRRRRAREARCRAVPPCRGAGRRRCSRGCDDREGPRWP